MPPGNNAGHDVTAVTGRELACFLEGGGQIRMRPAVAAIYDVENRLFANNPEVGSREAIMTWPRHSPALLVQPKRIANHMF